MSVKVIVYHQPDCPPCYSAMEFLKQRGVEFETKDVTTDAQALGELRALGSQSTPTIVVGDQLHVGFRPDLLQALLEAEGT